MILPILIWLLQDMLQVVFMGIFLVPELFLLALIFAGLQPDNERGHDFCWYIIVGFIGGLLWDFRWTNLPGLTAALNAGLITIVFLIWHFIPIQGRNEKSFAFCAIGSQFISAAIHAMLCTVPNMVVVRLFFIQQLMGVTLIILLYFVYKKAIYRHV